MKRSLKQTILCFVISSFCIQITYAERVYVEFADFPLKKMDKLYPRHVAQAVKFIFDLWYWLSYFEQIESSKNTLEEPFVSVIPIKHVDHSMMQDQVVTTFKNLVNPSLSTLRPVKTFVKKIVAEWCAKTSQSDLIHNQMLEILLVPDTDVFEILFSHTDQTLLKALKLFLYDGMKNVPLGIKECYKIINPEEIIYFELFMQEKQLLDLSVK